MHIHLLTSFLITYLKTMNREKGKEKKRWRKLIIEQKRTSIFRLKWLCLMGEWGFPSVALLIWGGGLFGSRLREGQAGLSVVITALTRQTRATDENESVLTKTSLLNLDRETTKQWKDEKEGLRKGR